MAGLLGDVLPWAFSQGDRAKRYLGGLLSDPIGSIQQTAGQIVDNGREMSGLLDRAWTDPAAQKQATQMATNGLLGFAPVGMTINTAALKSQFPDVDFSLTQSGKRATLSKVVVPQELRGQGQGTAFMQALAKAADEDGATVALSPSSDFGGNKARLQEFYRRFGFVPNKGRNIDYEISESMYRTPGK